MDTAMMKLSVLLLLVLLTLSSAFSPLDTGTNPEQRNASFKKSDLNGIPKITVNRSMLTHGPLLTVAVESSSFVSDEGSNLEWVTWNNSLPNNSFSIYNGYVKRIDYVCKYTCEAGFYTPSYGPYCNYPSGKKVYSGSPFEILVNKNNFEILEWKEASYGSVPQNSVRTCSKINIYVGQNKYGLGKVDSKDKTFYLPWKSCVYRYNYYQVLTINDDIISQQVYDVKYKTDESEIFKYPPEIMRETSIVNYECRPVVKTDTLSKTYEVQQRWDFTFSVKAGVRTSITAGIPLITSAGVEFSTEVTFQYSRGSTVVETITDTLSVELAAPPNHSCMVHMVRYKYKVAIPFTARLSRTYANGEIRMTSITGTYDSVQVAEVRAVVDRCELLENSKPCT